MSRSELILKLVKKNYQEIAAQFHLSRQRPLWPPLQKLVSQIENDSKILDVGCGNGRLINAFKNKKINYWGIDNCPQLLELARQQYPQAKFIEGDILALNKIPGLPSNFDYIFAVAVLHHLPDHELQLQAIEQLKNRLAPQGKLIITVWNFWQNTKRLKLMIKTYLRSRQSRLRPASTPEPQNIWPQLNWKDILFAWKNSQGREISWRYYYAFTKGDLKKLAKKSGLKIKQLWRDKYNYYLILKKN
ncbi:class I SAM-dependent methyltransferase [Candidatus Parcubacteria bacterium]|nr:MAG: class I SAM-dependent methyltransferase [Candidatus Parcubacteria bacterium]